MDRARRQMLWAATFAFILAPLASESALAQRKSRNGATEYMVEMRDGVNLATNVTLPKGEGSWPVILTRTPYNKEGGLTLGADRYTKGGYVFVVQDCRGRFRSEGEYEPFVTDRDDGYDTINWVAQQPWCNGKVGMSGASAMGITALLAATANPEALVAAFVVVAPESFWTEASFIGGVFKEADTGGWMRSQNAGHLVADRKASIERIDEELERDIIHHRNEIDIPIYHIGGWYDIFSVGTQGNFSFLQNHGVEGARGRQKLMMGPFGHGGLKGDLRYPGGGGILNALSEEIRWFDYHLKGVDNGIAEEPAVKYYQMAAARKRKLSEKNGFRTADNWPLPSRESRYYLSNPHGLSTAPPEAKQSATTYAFDPKNPVPTVGGANLTLPLGPMDQREIGDRPDYLRFETPPLEEAVTIAGHVTVELFASTDAPDTDFMAKLVDVYPDGYEALLLDTAQRARYREGRRPEQIKMMPPGEPVKMSIDLGSTANTFEKGHRIALHITSSNSPRFEVNANTGEPPGKADLPPRVAHNSIHHAVDHPTALVLPVIED